MSKFDGIWDCTMKTPVGEQKTALTIKSDGNTFTGTNSGTSGTAEIRDGKIEGDAISWTMEVKSPFPMKLEGKLTLAGDTLTGAIKAGNFGSFATTGTRRQ
jgi:heat shock protein HslJ